MTKTDVTPRRITNKHDKSPLNKQYIPTTPKILK